MGLFGGFKAKLIGGKVKKPKKDNSRVVCVKFNTFSEFDAQTNDLPSCSNANLGRNDVVKERKTPPPKPEVKDLFERVKINGTATPAPTTIPAQAPALATKSPTKAPPPTKFPTKAPAATKSPTKAPAPTKSPTKAPAPTKSPTKAPAPTKSPPTTKPPEPPTKEPKFERSRFAKAQAPKTPDVDVTSPPAVLKRAPPPIPESDSDDDDGGNFKIHVSQNGKLNVGNVSDDEDSWNGDSFQGSSSPITYSSQATSIFFGGEEEEVSRPRNVLFGGDDDDDLSDGSSASA